MKEDGPNASDTCKKLGVQGLN